MSPLYPPAWDEIQAPSITTEPPGPKSREILERVERTAYAGLASDMPAPGRRRQGRLDGDRRRRQRVHRLHLARPRRFRWARAGARSWSPPSRRSSDSETRTATHWSPS